MQNLAVLTSLEDEAVPHGRARKKWRPRHQVLDEVVSGFLWIDLDPPTDVTRQEMESLARRLVDRIQTGGDETAIIRILTIHQHSEYCRPVNPAAMRKLAQRTIEAVKGY